MFLDYLKHILRGDFRGVREQGNAQILFRPFASLKDTNILMAKASHMAKLRLKGWGSRLCLFMRTSVSKDWDQGEVKQRGHQYNQPNTCIIGK